MTSAFSWQNSQSLPCFILYYKAKFDCYSSYLLTSYFYIPVLYNEKDILFECQFQKVLWCSQNHSTSASSALLVRAQTWITVMLNGLPWKQTEIILPFLRLHSSTTSQTLVDYEGYSSSSKGFLHRPLQLQQSSELNSPISIHFSAMIAKLSMFTLAISCLTTSNSP